MSITNLYETDFYAWTMYNAQLLREKCIDGLDFEHLAEEIANMGASEKRELQNRLEVLIAHLLKLHYLEKLRPQNERGWLVTIKEQRKRIAYCLDDTPSLKSKLPELVKKSYPLAIYQIIALIDVPETIFPAVCPYPLEHLLNNDFYPVTLFPRRPGLETNELQ